MKKVLIIGAGIGGLSTAVRLLSKGYEVEILEKQDTIGGKVNQISDNGYKFDLTASVLMNPNIYKDLFAYANKDYSKYIDLIRLDPIYRVNYYDGSSYDFYSDDNRNISTLESIEKNSSVGYMKCLSKSYEKYKIINNNFLEKQMNKLNQMINCKNLTNILKINPLPSSYKFFSKYIKNEKILDYLTFQAMYIGVNPFEESNLYTLIPTISKLYGLGYIKGGMYAYIQALEKLIYELGGKIHKNIEVKEILIDDSVVKGARCKDKNYYSDIVVCNADYPYAVRHLIKNKDYKKVVNQDYSCSTFIMYLGLRKKYEQLQVHNIYIGKNFEKNIKSAFKGKLPKNPSLYLYYPSKIDKNISGNFDSILNVMVRVPNLKDSNIKWNKEVINNFRDIIIKELKNIDGLENIDNEILYESYLTPVQLKNKFYSYNGTAFGLSHKLNQTAYFRPHIKDENIKGLYFIGSSTHPGNGVSVIIDGSKIVADEIYKEYK